MLPRWSYTQLNYICFVLLASEFSPEPALIVQLDWFQTKLVSMISMAALLNETGCSYRSEFCTNISHVAQGNSLALPHFGPAKVMLNQVWRQSGDFVTEKLTFTRKSLL